MEKQVKDIDWLGQRALGKHPYFFNQMRFGRKGCQADNHAKNQQQGKGYFLYPLPHPKVLSQGPEPGASFVIFFHAHMLHSLNSQLLYRATLDIDNLNIVSRK